MLRPVRFVAFNRPIDLPLKAQTDNVSLYDPEFRDSAGYLLSYDSEVEMLRVEVPKQKISSATGVGVLSAGMPVKTVFGKEPVQHVPREMISRIVFVDDQQPQTPSKK